LKLEQLTFTRFLAAIMIVFHHYSKGFFPFNTATGNLIVQHANIGVSYFYLLSGFVLMIAYGNKEKIVPAQFYLNRVARIYPLYFLSLLLILISYVAAHQMDNYRGLLLNLFVVQAWFPPEATKFNAQTWSIGVEFFFYLVFPLLLTYVYRKIKISYVLLMAIVFWLFTQILFNGLLKAGYDQGLNTSSHNILFYFPPMHLNEFVLGNLAGWFFLKQKKNTFKYHDWLLMGCFTILIYIMAGEQPISYHNGLMALIFIPVILILSEGSGWLSRVFAKRPLIFLGEISYGIYILQYPVFIFNYSVLKKLNITDPALKFYISLLVLILFAAFCYKYIEMPARKWIQGLYKPGARLKKSIPTGK